MTFKELATRRYSCRNYTAEPVSEEDVAYIMECARIAPSAVNLQPWHFYVITQDELRQHIIQCYQREWIAQAPLFILCTVRHDQQWVRKADLKPHGNIDIAIAAEHICLAAAERGLGTCWVCNFDATLCHKLFDLPEQEEAAVIIPVGHIDTTIEAKRNERKPLTDIVTRW
ncbi:MAG: nitroreductase family protein [Bacteroidaceae bacterium]|nr:nitroreductase family protein [Bacteroidaceae bacterium]